MILRRSIHLSPVLRFVTLQFLIFIHISVEVGMGLILLMQAKMKKVREAGKCIFAVAQSSILVVSPQSERHPMGILRGLCAFDLLQIIGWREGGAPKVVYTTMKYCTG